MGPGNMRAPAIARLYQAEASAWRSTLGASSCAFSFEGLSGAVIHVRS